MLAVGQTFSVALRGRGLQRARLKLSGFVALEAFEQTAFGLDHFGGLRGRDIGHFGRKIGLHNRLRNIGSQGRADDSIIRFMKIVLFACLVFAVPVVALGAPAQKPSAKAPVVSIDPKARAIFARAVKLYSAAKTLSVRWKSRNESGETSNAALDFNRAGRLRLVNVDPFEPLIVMDGKTRWSLGSPDDLDENGRATYRRIEADDVDMEMQLAPGLAGVLGNLLNEVGPLDTGLESDAAESLELQELRALVLPAQPFSGQACDLVRVSHVYAPLTKNGPTSVGQQTFWFARTNGALVRFQERSVMARKDMNVADAQVTAQTFNPKFAPNAFKFTPPKGAVLSEY